ncbi:MAG: hypothetical protein HGA54_08810 [Actinobacteria bacterium]|nr:hypothetical protein [Actinomycetota bacterium]
MSLQNIGKRRTITIALLLVAFLIGAGVVFLIQAPVIHDLENRLKAAEIDLEAATIGQGAEDASVDGSSDYEGDGSDDGEGTCIVDKDATTENLISWTAYALLSDARIADGVTYATLDYIQVLTGDAATQTAAEHGEETTPEGYYIVNECPELHEYPIDDGITISVVYNETTGWDPDAPVYLSLEEWRYRAIVSMETMYGIQYYAMYHVVTVTDGTITAMDQKYLP